MAKRHRRLDQLLVQQGLCSRAEARRVLAADRVWREGGEVCRDVAERIDPATLRIDGNHPEAPDGLLVLFHKPIGVVSAHDDRDGPSLYPLLPERWLRRSPQLNHVGRLDKETSGLLLLTDVGPLVQRLTSPKHHVEKVYEAQLDREVDPAWVEQFAKGVRLESDETPCLPAKLESLPDRKARVTLSEGRYHQVRRMFAAVGGHVESLARVRFGSWTLEGIEEPGAWRAVPLPEGFALD